MSGRRIATEAQALLQLSALPGVGLRGLCGLVSTFGSARVALEDPRARFAALTNNRAASARDAPLIEAATRDGLRRAADAGMVLCTWSDPRYPPMLHQLADPPPVLFLRGRVELLARPGVTIVGSRKATARGREIARSLGAALAHSGITVVSGMALGIDGAAHSGAVEGGGGTIAVLGCGADRAYPASNRRLFRDILRDGLVVSEFLPGTPALPHHFPRRNRILAGLSHTIVVVEAARKSGSLITVEHALDLGLEVTAVPGPIDQAACDGSNSLLADGARPLVSVTDFVRELGGQEVAPAGAAEGLRGPERRVVLGLERGPAQVDELASRLGMDVRETLTVLAALEISGRVVQEPGLRFRRAS